MSPAHKHRWQSASGWEEGALLIWEQVITTSMAASGLPSLQTIVPAYGLSWALQTYGARGPPWPIGEPMGLARAAHPNSPPR